MTEEWRRLVCAIQFLARLPVPSAQDWDQDRLSRSAKYFPLVGLLVGGLSAGVFLHAHQLWPTGLLPALLAVAVGVAITGAFHEDGLADAADGLGGGLSVDDRLRIMKDSRLGSYGALALGLVLAIKIAALSQLAPGFAAVILVCAHGGGRAAAVVVMTVTPYVADPDRSKWKPTAEGVRRVEALVAVAIAAAPLVLLEPVDVLACTVAGAAAASALMVIAHRLIGGHTGDILGAVEQVFEVAFVLAAAAMAVVAP